LWRPGRLAAVAFVLLCGLGGRVGGRGSPEPVERPLIAELRWMDPNANAVTSLTVVPAECLVMPPEPDRARLARLGRVAFRSPVLLGGLAGRVGLSCDSCHRNGHDNPVFHFVGVSGEPGTADVTGAVFSRHRDDGRSNPVAIPSLLDAGSAPPFGSILPAPDLRTFLHAAIVDEFQGVPPPQSVVDGLIEYVSGLQSRACPEPREESVHFVSDAAAILETFDVVMESLSHADRRGGEFALLSLRAALEKVYRRFPRNVLAREDLLRRSRALSLMRTRLGEKDLSQAIALLAAERTRLEAVLRKLGKRTGESFYQPDVLRRALGEGPPPLSDPPLESR